MKIIIAPDSFKECLPAAAVAQAIGEGLKAAWSALGSADERLEIVSVPMADGGEGTAETVLAAAGGHMRYVTVTGPLGEPVQASFGLLADGTTAVIEMASAAGLHLVPLDRRDPTKTTTFGVAQLIRAALDAGGRKILIGIGGSSTTDGGVGCAQGLGWRFLDQAGKPIPGPMTGGDLLRIHRIDASGQDVRLRQAEIVVACDVDNPLTGPQGSAAVYGPQKGATPEQVRRLDAGLGHLAGLMHKDLGLDVEQMPGAGAAGGLGAGLVAFCRASLCRGVESVGRTVDLAGKISGADLVITGEGRLDAQSLRGKVIYGVASEAKRFGVPTVAIAGQVQGSQNDWSVLLAGRLCIIDGPMPLAEALREAPRLLRNAGEQMFRMYLLGKRGRGDRSLGGQSPGMDNG
jgi:glycerate 2-kinase